MIKHDLTLLEMHGNVEIYVEHQSHDQDFKLLYRPKKWQIGCLT